MTDGQVSLGIHPGRHKITADAPGFAPEEWVLEAAPASVHSHEFKLAPKAMDPVTPGSMHVQTASPAETTADAAPSKSTRIPTGVYVGAAATGVFAVAATVTGRIALSKQNDHKNAPTVAKPTVAEPAARR